MHDRPGAVGGGGAAIHPFPALSIHSQGSCSNADSDAVALGFPESAFSQGAPRDLDASGQLGAGRRAEGRIPQPRSPTLAILMAMETEDPCSIFCPQGAHGMVGTHRQTVQ